MKNFSLTITCVLLSLSAQVFAQCEKDMSTHPLNPVNNEFLQLVNEWDGNNGPYSVNSMLNTCSWFPPANVPYFNLNLTNGSSTPLRLHSSGKVGINTDHFPGNHSLYVKGSMIIEEVIVREMGDWGDFVFEPDYPLMPLAELDSYLAEHKHLPEFPSAKEVAENGLALGETQRLLTEKVEELTLYLLEISSQLQAVTDRNEALNGEVETLRQEITTLRGEK